MSSDDILLLIQVVVFPVVYVCWVIRLEMTKKRKGLAISLVLFALSYGAGIWAVTRPGPYRTPAAHLLLPFESMVAGVLGLAFAYGWSGKNVTARIGGPLALTAAVLLIAGRVWMTQGSR